MDKKAVRVLADLQCDWEGLSPIYRLYVNDELFVERTWIWDSGTYLEESVPITAEPGQYTLRWELVPPNLAKLTVENIRVNFGPGYYTNDKLYIQDENL